MVDEKLGSFLDRKLTKLLLIFFTGNTQIVYGGADLAESVISQSEKVAFSPDLKNI
jgi:hypothetical protein